MTKICHCDGAKRFVAIYFLLSLQDLPKANRGNLNKHKKIDCHEKLRFSRNDGWGVDCFDSRYRILQ